MNKEPPCHVAVAPVVRRIDVNDLLGHSRELIIVHKNAEYRLRLTRNDKLILTK
ncbi:MAG: hemin uptake protein HemP [Alphaproteobacteria bacterium]|nr:hemin uptake protein HemP [Alphaproteobacteria bacterium]